MAAIMQACVSYYASVSSFIISIWSISHWQQARRESLKVSQCRCVRQEVSLSITLVHLHIFSHFLRKRNIFSHFSQHRKTHSISDTHLIRLIRFFSAEAAEFNKTRLSPFAPCSLMGENETLYSPGR